MGFLGPKYIFNSRYHFISILFFTVLYHLKRGLLEKGILVMRADRVLSRTWGSQGHKGTSNNQIDQRVNHKGDEMPIIHPSSD